MEHSIGTIEKNLYRLICSFLLSCIFTYNFGRYIGVRQQGIVCGIVLFILAFIVSLFVFLVERYKWVVVLATLALGIAAATIVGWDAVCELGFGYIEWMYKSTETSTQQIMVYSTIQMIWIVIVSYGLQEIMERVFYVKLTFGIILVVLLIYFLFSKYDASYVGVLFILVFCALLVIQWTELKWKKEKKCNHNVYMLWMAVFIGMFFLLMLRMPVSEQPFRWDFVKTTVDYCEEKLRMIVKDIFQKEDIYDLALSGFSDEGRLGEGVIGDDKEIMLVTSDRRMQMDLYLTGKYFNTFENMTWMAYQQEEDYDRYMDTLQTSYAVLKYDSEDLNLYSIKTSLNITYQELNTAYLFAPNKIYGMANSKGQIDYAIGDGSIYFHKNQNYGSCYQTNFYQMNSSVQPFIDFLKTPVEQDDKLWDRTFSNYEMLIGTLFNQEQMEQYRQRCYDDYLITPDVSDEVLIYLDDITADCESDIDKLLAIESELSSYTYTATPGQLPEDVVDAKSFLDYFLLDSQSGYCTYYATAFVLLARAEGFPARYVQGYCVPMCGERHKTVLSSMAHAWPEVYIDGIGWVAFEPTPGYRESGYQFNASGQNSYYGNSHNTNMNNGNANKEDLGFAESDEFTQDNLEISPEHVSSLVLKIIVFALIGIVLGFAFLTLIAQLMYLKKSTQEKYYLKVKRNIRLLSMLGAKLSDTETLFEYRLRAGDKIENASCLGFLGDYEDVIYGGRIIDELLIGSVDKQYKEALLNLKKQSYHQYLAYIIIKIIRCDIT